MAKGDYAPKVSRSVTRRLAKAEHPAPQAYEEPDDDEDEGELIAFEPDPEFVRMIEEARARREEEQGIGQTRH